MKHLGIKINEKHLGFEAIVFIVYSQTTAAMGNKVQLVGGCDPYRLDSPDRPLTIGGLPTGKGVDLEIYPGQVIVDMANGRFPSELTFILLPINSKVSTKCNVPMPGIKNTALQLYSYSYIAFYENIKNKIEMKFGEQPSKWPSILNFARVIRNSFAHGNIVNFINPRASKVSWENLSLGPVDNGKQVLFSLLGLSDIILLIFEIGNELQTPLTKSVGQTARKSRIA